MCRADVGINKETHGSIRNRWATDLPLLTVPFKVLIEFFGVVCPSPCRTANAFSWWKSACQSFFARHRLYSDRHLLTVRQSCFVIQLDGFSVDDTTKHRCITGHFSFPSCQILTLIPHPSAFILSEQDSLPR